SPLMISFEDVHWSDAQSLELVARAARRLVGTSSLLVVLTAREEEIVDAPGLDRLIRELSREGLLRRLGVEALGREHVHQLARSVVGSGSAAQLDRVCERAWRMSEGNALLAIEAARDAASSRRSRGANTSDAVR